MTTAKAYRGIGMEGAIANWYARNTGRDLSRFKKTARLIAGRIRPGSDVLEVAPGPGYLAIELAKQGYAVTALDISKSFVKMTLENAAHAGVRVDVRHGNAAAMPFADASFDVVVCAAAFKNFTDPVGALNEMCRVLRPGGQASILDLRKDATPEEIAADVSRMGLSARNAALTRWTFRFMLLKRAYTRAQLEQIASQSRFSKWEVTVDGIGFELRLTRGPVGER
jgi:ubiquinone/menaquinone biosynthesis C-methylase UbiE